MKRHKIPPLGGSGSEGAPKRERTIRPPSTHAAPSKGREPEPEPIRIPPTWMPSDRKARRHRNTRVAAKAAVLIAAFALLSLPFMLNHFEKGSFYYQEVPVVLPDLAAPDVIIEPAETPLPVELEPTEPGSLATPEDQGMGITAPPDAVDEGEAPAADQASTPPESGDDTVTAP